VLQQSQNPPSMTHQIMDVAERTIFTAGEALVAILLTKGSLSFSAAEVTMLTAVAAGIAGVRTVVSQAIDRSPGPKEWLEDLFSRAIFTFAETLVASLITSATTGLNLSALQSAGVAGLAAALTAVKAALARGSNLSLISPASFVPTSTGTNSG
jgi:hypothetical protein